MIDKHYFTIDAGRFYRDYLLAVSLFLLAFIACWLSTGLLAVIFYLVGVFAIYRAAVFIHDISHHPDHPRLKRFKTLWDLTAGALLLLPAVRFIKPHRLHHTIGIFGTERDPQYLLMRSNRMLTLQVLFLVPLVAPVFSLMQVLGSTIPGIDLEARIEAYLRRRGVRMEGVLSAAHKREVAVLSYYYLLLFILYLLLFPKTLPLLYAFEVGGWFLGTLRIPLEHGMRRHKENSDREDQMRDSFTVESPWAALLMPLSLQHHTAHHMYPGVPYHNLPALHRELKASRADYRQSVVSFLAAVRGPSAID